MLGGVGLFCIGAGVRPVVGGRVCFWGFVGCVVRGLCPVGWVGLCVLEDVGFCGRGVGEVLGLCPEFGVVPGLWPGVVNFWGGGVGFVPGLGVLV